ncbi:hypothetical protein AA101099_2285 [Neoasaia chiangmaiensis NBRC 101099]|uniref:Uncharacterized protein n=1 Tax=Neoasaia chiangmaiensis TaxID=320497 RepID=A0A1U9KSK3_9PROT|nr:hypothetical protein [Neoasaia chiangmaiensis]AQS88765.1 hypothetical protein A0U93_13480 [Neoasaia chiangmaiensis]GBR40811.1 hypothetical protein AA101099_2285 [Neoasaia chiangmaiensis NBRC 101099]GEN13726.1 hypothetical protein NCH01_01570 [Neoasaia chiangmaiensis]
MSYAALDAARVAKAAKSALTALEQTAEKTEAHQRKTVMVERIHALAGAAADTNQQPGGGLVTLTSEEFWLISRNW